MTDALSEVSSMGMSADTAAAIVAPTRSSKDDITLSLENAKEQKTIEEAVLFSVPSDVAIDGVDASSDSDRDNDGRAEPLSEAAEAAKKTLISTIGDQGVDFLSEARYDGNYDEDESYNDDGNENEGLYRDKYHDDSGERAQDQRIRSPPSLRARPVPFSRAGSNGYSSVGLAITPPSDSRGRRARARRAREHRESETVGGETRRMQESPQSGGVILNTWKRHLHTRGRGAREHGAREQGFLIETTTSLVSSPTQSRGNNDSMGSIPKPMQVVGNENNKSNHSPPLPMDLEMNDNKKNHQEVTKPTSPRLPFEDGIRRIKEKIMREKREGAIASSVRQLSHSATVSGGYARGADKSPEAKILTNITVTPSASPRHFNFDKGDTCRTSTPSKHSNTAIVSPSSSTSSSRTSFEGGVKRARERLLKERREKIGRPHS